MSRQPVQAIVWIAASALLFLIATAGMARAEPGVVAFRVSSCDYYLIRTNNGYVLAEWYGAMIHPKAIS
jgi:hypothetical protein